MAGGIDRRPAAEDDLIEIWVYIARANERAADQALDRIGRARPELASGLRSFPIGRRVAF